MSDKFVPYQYLKSEPKAVSQSKSVVDKKSSENGRNWFRIVPSVLITLGSIMIANVVWPILSYQLFTSPDIQRSELVSPVPMADLGSSPAEMPIIPDEKMIATNPSAPQVLGADVDYTNPSTWFPQAGYSDDETADTYLVTIPAVDVENAEVEVGGDDLDEALIHYPGTALPGQLGSPVIFGHSILRQFYNPDEDNPNRYNSIFSKIMTLENGDRIFVDYDGVKYTYEVKDKVEVKPEDLFILEQRYNNRELKLITCTPEGTYLRRGVVLAQLVNLSDLDVAELEEN